MHRTGNQVRQIRFKGVSASFTRQRAAVVAEASEKGLAVTLDDGVAFVAEGLNSCNERIWLHAGPRGSPSVNGPSVTRRYWAVEYATLLLPKAA